MDLVELEKRWQGKRIYCRLTTGDWVLGDVRFISWDGFIYVDLLGSGENSTQCFGYPVDQISRMLRLA